MATYKEFEEALAADQGLRARFTELAKEFDPKNEGEVLEAKRAAAAKLGFDVPASEFRLAMLAAQELDDEQLDIIAGGVNAECNTSFKNCDAADLVCLSKWNCATKSRHPAETCSRSYECSFWIN